jgi:flagellin
MRINHNISAMNSYRQTSTNNANQAKNMERLSTGLRINRGADDAAGLAISEKMRAQIRGLDQAQRNSQDGISLIQTADGALNEGHSILQRMRELAVQAASDTNVDTDRDALQSEYDELLNELGNIKDNTQFNKQSLLDKKAGSNGDGNVILQTGANNAETLTLDLTTKGIDLTAIVGTDLAGKTLDTNANAATALTAIDTAIADVSTGRAKLGAYQNRLEYGINNLASASQNTQAAESRIRDVDMAKEMLENSKNSILAQAAQAMLAQANQSPQSVLQLLRG